VCADYRNRARLSGGSFMMTKTKFSNAGENHADELVFSFRRD